MKTRFLERIGLGPRRGGWRKRSDPVRGRRHALREEVGYWDEWLATKGGKWPDDYRFRFDPDAEVKDPALREALAEVTQDEISILDVGAGPASAVGCRFPGKRLSLTAVDPLADDFNSLLDRHGVEPPTRTEKLEGERLDERFGRDRFDVAFSRNALDHAVDPIRIIEQMLAVVRPGGRVVLNHRRNEALDEDYVQLHQWNFDEHDGDLVLWRPNQETNIGERLGDRADLECRLRDGWIACQIVKRPGRRDDRQV